MNEMCLIRDQYMYITLYTIVESYIFWQYLHYIDKSINLMGHSFVYTRTSEIQAIIKKIVT